MATALTRRCACVLAALVVCLGLCRCGDSKERELRVRATGPEGRLLTMFGGDIQVFLEDPDSKSVLSHAQTQDNDGWWSLVQRQSDVTLKILSPGCRPFSVSKPEPDTEAQLVRGIPVVIRVSLDGDLPKSPLSLELTVEAAEEETTYRKSLVAGDAWFSSPHEIRDARLALTHVDDELRIWFPRAGRYKLGWMLFRRRDIRTPRYTSLGGEGHGPGAKAEVLLEIADQLGQAFEFHVHSGHLANTLKFFE